MGLKDFMNLGGERCFFRVGRYEILGGVHRVNPQMSCTA
jgi:hypothetical protein